MFTFENEGALLQRSNYWYSDECAAGRMFLTWNDGVGRLLVPDTIRDALFPEISSTNYVEIIEETDRLKLYVHDTQPEPYRIQIETGMTDRRTLAKGNTRIDVYVLMGLKYQFKAVIL